MLEFDEGSMCMINAIPIGGYSMLRNGKGEWYKTLKISVTETHLQNPRWATSIVLNVEKMTIEEHYGNSEVFRCTPTQDERRAAIPYLV